jgi:hypothetical protein
MARRCFCRFLALAFLLFAPAGIVAQDNEAKHKPIPGIEVVLTFSIKDLDPKKPGDSFVECVVKNGSGKTIQVPAIYTGGWDQDMCLEANDLRLVHWAADKKQTNVALEPGKGMVVFKAALIDVLLLGPDGGKKPVPTEPRFYWSWNK